jgi:hypothetical protein
VAKTNNTVSRRGFIGAIGAAAAASVLSPVALAAPATSGGPVRWTSATADWHAAQARLVERFRPAYLAELERFAEELRPGFVSGELRGYRDVDEGLGYDARQAGDEDYIDPDARLEELCAEHFGLEVEQAGSTYVGDEAMANLILAMSPAAEHWQPGTGWYHPANRATLCVAWDVLAIARALGIYEATADESPSLEATAWAREVRQ